VYGFILAFAWMEVR